MTRQSERHSSALRLANGDVTVTEAITTAKEDTMENIYLGWNNGAYYEVHDAYLDGECKRCGRNRRECQKLIETTDKRCTQTKPYPLALDNRI